MAGTAAHEVHLVRGHAAAAAFAPAAQRHAAALLRLRDHVLARLREARDPLRDLGDPQHPAELVAEVAAVVLQDVVLVARPLLLQERDELQHLALRRGRHPQVHRPVVRVALAVAGPAAEDPADRRVGQKGRVAVAPLPVVDLYPAVVQAHAEGPEGAVDRPAGPGGPDVVDVQHHRHGDLRIVLSAVEDDYRLRVLGLEVPQVGQRPLLAVLDPRGDGVDTQHPAQLVAEVRALARGGVGAWPLFLEQPDQAQQLVLGHGRAPHGDGLTIGEALAGAGPAAEDPRRGRRGIQRGPVAPLPAVDLYTAMVVVLRVGAVIDMQGHEGISLAIGRPPRPRAPWARPGAIRAHPTRASVRRRAGGDEMAGAASSGL
eukprot:CAMPEP_0179273950 /NCGR_PEP_ID=MMETSP0797-20121207/33273_1 /TAXON_ID=47934 /ORGANISM="Dinophysis acuminata, Strain DAEP01" /LENGTH=372 /DNA_ID=CAMNT_0020982385 /DNA_START=135 /DNA_END=1249 /DNA_ORIENTATION=+